MGIAFKDRKNGSNVGKNASQKEKCSLKKEMGSKKKIDS